MPTTVSNKRVQTRKRYRKRYPSKVDAYTVKKIARQEVKKAEKKDIEVKIFDGTITTRAIDYSGTSCVWGLMDGILSDTTDFGVVGSKIRPVGIAVNFSLIIGDSTNLVRVFLVQFKGPLSTPTVGGMLESVGNIRAPLSFYEKDYNDTYKVLFDKTYSLEGYNAIQVDKIKVGQTRLRRMALKFQGSPLTLAAYEDGALYMFAVSDSAAEAHPTILGHWRVYYTDA